MFYEKVDLLADIGCEIGEGPVWDEKTGQLYFIDLILNNIHVYKNGKITHTTHLDQNVGCIALREQGGFVAGLQHGINFLEPLTGERQLIQAPESHKPRNRFNDGKCDAAGRFWAGTMSKDLDTGFGDAANQGALYCLLPDHSIVRKIDQVTLSNGLAWSNDNRFMYYIDSPTQTVVAYDFDIDTGNIANRRVLFEFDPLKGLPDGMCIDEEGMLWVAFWNGGVVRRCDPAKRQIIGEMAIPALNVTSMAFGGENMDMLFVTTGKLNTDLSDYPHAGALFAVQTGVRGPFVSRYKG